MPDQRIGIVLFKGGQCSSASALTVQDSTQPKLPLSNLNPHVFDLKYQHDCLRLGGLC